MVDVRVGGGRRRAAAATRRRGRGRSSRPWRPRRCRGTALASDAPSASDDAVILGHDHAAARGRRGAPPPLRARRRRRRPLEARARAALYPRRPTRPPRARRCAFSPLDRHTRSPRSPSAASSSTASSPPAPPSTSRLDGLRRPESANADPSSQSNDLAPPIVVHSVDPPDARRRVDRGGHARRLVDDVTKPSTGRPEEPLGPSERIAGADEARRSSAEGVRGLANAARRDAARSARVLPARRSPARPAGRRQDRLRRGRRARGGREARGPERRGRLRPYAGDAEARLRGAFRDADAAPREGTPAVLIIDEIDAMCPARGARTRGWRLARRRAAAHPDGRRRIATGRRAARRTVHGGSTRRRRTSRSTRSTRWWRRRPTKRVGPGASASREASTSRWRFLCPPRSSRLAILRVHARARARATWTWSRRRARTAKGYSGADLARSAARRRWRPSGTPPSRRRTKPNEQFGDGAIVGDGSMRVTARHFSTAAGRVGASVTRGVALEFSATTWDDVGGLDDVKRRLRQAVESTATRRGVRRAGPVGARGDAAPRPAGVREDHDGARRGDGVRRDDVIALAAADVFSKYVGEGERRPSGRLRARASAPAPAVLLLATRSTGWSAPRRGQRRVLRRGGGRKHRERRPRACCPRSSWRWTGWKMGGGGGDDGDDERRDGDGVLVVATTNRPNALDAALTRPGPGRLDLVLYVPRRRARKRGGAARARARRSSCGGRGPARGRDSNRTVHGRRAPRRDPRSRAGGVARGHGRGTGWEAHLDAALRATRPALAESGSREMGGFVPSDMRRRIHER